MMKKHLLLLLLILVPHILHAQGDPAVRIYFEHDSAALSAKAKMTLDSLAPLLKDRKATVSIAGYTDDSGTAHYNEALAVQRANSAKDYLSARGIAATARGVVYARAYKPATPQQQRAVVITLVYEDAQAAGYGPQEFTGPGGTIVIASVENGSAGAVTISEYFSPATMIKDGMYAIDTDGRVLQTDGMIEICGNSKKLNPNGKTYTIKMPATRGRINRKMKIWLAIAGENGNIRWQDTPIEVTTDPSEKYYIFEVPAGTQGCLKINLDRPTCGTGGVVALDRKDADVPVVVYVETADAFDFHDVSLSTTRNNRTPGQQLSFSAKLTDRLWAFTAQDGDDVRNLVFTGKYRDGSKDMKYSKLLSRARYRFDEKDRSHHFYLKDRKKADTVPQKGFWAWVRRQFKGQ